jgi:hypothetical protein
MRFHCEIKASDPWTANGSRVCPSASTKRSLRTDPLAAMRSQLAALTIGARLAVADA